MPEPGPRNDLTDRVFDRLTVIECAGRTPDRQGYLWACRCSCGTPHFVTRGKTLLNGMTSSCGCKRREYEKWTTAIQGKEVTSDVDKEL